MCIVQYAQYVQQCDHYLVAMSEVGRAGCLPSSETLRKDVTKFVMGGRVYELHHLSPVLLSHPILNNLSSSKYLRTLIFFFLRGLKLGVWATKATYVLVAHTPYA